MFLLNEGGGSSVEKNRFESEHQLSCKSTINTREHRLDNSYINDATCWNMNGFSGHVGVSIFK